MSTGTLSFGERAADKISSFIGSWKFVLAQTAILIIWFTVNGVGLAMAWDPYPFILANLFMSAEAAFATPLLLMSQNRAAEMDRKILYRDYEEDKETNLLVERIADHLGVTRD